MKGRTVALLRPPIISSKGSFSIPVTPPIALAYLAANLERHGIKVECIDGLGEDLDHIEMKSRGRKAQGLSFEKIAARINDGVDILGVSVMFSQEWPLVRDLILMIKERHPGLIVIAGGEHITAMPEFSLQDCAGIDYCGLGEGDELLLEFVQAIRSGRNLEGVAGLVYRDGHRYARTAPRQRIREIAQLPRPSWDRLPIEAYLSSGYGNGINNGRNMPILATRGCPYQCTFCSVPVMWNQRYTVRPAEDVIQEIQHYVEKYQATHVEFYDLTAIIRKQWILDFCNLYLENKMTVGWSLPSGTRSEALDDEVLALLQRTNCRYLVYAPESGSENTLKQIKKAVHLNRMISSIKTAIRHGINTRCNLIIGFPNERIGDVARTLWFQIRLAWLGVDDAPIYMFSPYPGSELFNNLRETKRIAEINDEYFDTLLGQMDLNVSNTYCAHVGSRTLRTLRISGMCAFYGLSYLLRPWRILRTARNILFKRMTNTVFEQRILEMFKRQAVRTLRRSA